MCTATSNDLGKLTSGDEIWSWEIQKFISIFSETVKDRVIKFSLMIDLSKNPSRILIYLAIRRKTYSLLATRTFLVIFLFVFQFSPKWFDGLSWNFQRLISIRIRPGFFFFFIFLNFTCGRPIWPKRRLRCPAFFSETVKDRVTIFSELIDLTL
jgi:hypothetical protein